MKPRYRIFDSLDQAKKAAKSSGDEQGIMYFAGVCQECAQPELRPHHHEPEPVVPSSPVAVLTPATLGALWGMTPSKIRDLCRTARIPARKLGPKEWIIPVAALKRWARQNPLAPQVTAGYTGPRDTRPGQAAAPQARPYRVEVRRPDRLPSRHAAKMGGRAQAGQSDGGAPDAAAGAAD